MEGPSGRVHQLLLFEGRGSALEQAASKVERRVVDLAAAFLGEEQVDIAYTHPGISTCFATPSHQAGRGLVARECSCRP